MTKRDTRGRLADAALDLFEIHGFDDATVEQIVARAGVSKTTFFRHFRAKEEVIFPDHQKTIADIETMFGLSDGTDRLATVCNGAKHVVARYLAEGDVARRRYRLTRTVGSLRDTEVASIQLYQQVFMRYLTADKPHDWQRRLTAEVQAAAVIAATNFVIRRWLRGEIKRPLPAFDEARDRLLATNWSAWSASSSTPEPTRTGPRRTGNSIVVVQTDRDLDAVLEVLHRTLDAE